MEAGADKLAMFKAIERADSMPRIERGSNRTLMRSIMQSDTGSENVFYGLREINDYKPTARSARNLGLANRWDRLAEKYRRRGQHRKAARYERKSQANQAAPFQMRKLTKQVLLRVFCRTQLDEAWLLHSMQCGRELECQDDWGLCRVCIVSRGDPLPWLAEILAPKSALLLAEHYSQFLHKSGRALFERLQSVTTSMVSLRFERLADSHSQPGWPIVGVVHEGDDLFPAIVLVDGALPLVAVLKQWKWPCDERAIPIIRGTETWGPRDLSQIQLRKPFQRILLHTKFDPSRPFEPNVETECFEQVHWVVPKRHWRTNTVRPVDVRAFVRNGSSNTIEADSVEGLILSAMAITADYCRVIKGFAE